MFEFNPKGNGRWAIAALAMTVLVGFDRVEIDLIAARPK
jgi:hypothetical protein